MSTVFDISTLSASELQQLTADIKQQLNKKSCIEGLNNFSTSSTRAEVRKYLITQYGVNENKTLLSDETKPKGSAFIIIKCKDCDTFKLHCKLSVSKNKGGWAFVDGECNMIHDILCMGSYTPKTVRYLYFR